MPKACIRVATSLPMRPSPSTPSVFPFSSMPMYWGASGGVSDCGPPSGHPPRSVPASYLLSVPFAFLHGGCRLRDLPARGGCGQSGAGGCRTDVSPPAAPRSPGQAQDHPTRQLGGAEAVPGGRAGDGERCQERGLTSGVTPRGCRPPPCTPKPPQVCATARGSALTSSPARPSWWPPPRPRCQRRCPLCPPPAASRPPPGRRR